MLKAFRYTGGKSYENNNSIKTVVAIGIGAALFFVLGRFVAIPSPVPNTNISLQYAVLGLLAAMYGRLQADSLVSSDIH